MEEILKQLAKIRPIFHSEADFQHAFAWAIHTKNPVAIVRLETQPSVDHRQYLDLLIKDEKKTYPIELKYKTRKLNTEYNDEEFHLVNQGAQDHGRYDFIKDVVRLEYFASLYDEAVGYAIFLTNDPMYWESSNRTDTVDTAFRIHEGRTLRGQLEWSKDAAKGTTKGREDSLILTGTYQLEWNDYSNLKEKLSEFRYLLIEINSKEIV